MTKQVRDWQEDMEMCEQSKANGFSDGLSFLTILPEIGIYWLQQYAAEKERADKSELSLKNATYLVEHANNRLKAAEAREKKLKEAIEGMMPGMWDGMRVHFEVVLASLYPEEGTK